MKKPDPLIVRTPLDLLGKEIPLKDPFDIPTGLRIDLVEFPSLDPEIGFFDRVVFYGKKVLPFAFSVLRFYFPLPGPVVSLVDSLFGKNIIAEEVPVGNLKSIAGRLLAQWIMGAAGGYLTINGISSGTVEEIAGGIISILISVITSLLSHKKALTSEPPR